MRHFFTSKVRITLLAAVLLAVILAVVSSLTGLSLPDMFVKGVLTPLRTGVSKLTDKAQQMYSYAFEYESIVAENEDLKEKVSELEEDARQADAVLRENERLRALLELKAAHEDYELVDGYIISRSSNDWTNTFTINTGANVGI